VLWQHVVLCKGTLLRMRLTVGVRSVLPCVTFNVKCYVSALVGVIIKVIVQNARCNSKDKFYTKLLNLRWTRKQDADKNCDPSVMICNHCWILTF